MHTAIPGFNVLPVADFLLVVVEPTTHIHGDVALGVEPRCQRVTEHRAYAVVAAHDDEAAFLGGEDIELRERGLRGDVLQGSGVLHTLRLHPGLRHAARHILRHGLGKGDAHHRQQ